MNDSIYSVSDTQRNIHRRVIFFSRSSDQVLSEKDVGGISQMWVEFAVLFLIDLKNDLFANAQTGPEASVQTSL